MEILASKIFSLSLLKDRTDKNQNNWEKSEIKIKHAEFITSLSIFKGDAIDAEFSINSYWLEKSEM